MAFYSTDRLLVRYHTADPSKIELRPQCLKNDGSTSVFGTSYTASTGFVEDSGAGTHLSFKGDYWLGGITLPVIRAIQSWPTGTVTYQNPQIEVDITYQLLVDRQLEENLRIQNLWRSGGIEDLPLEVCPDKSKSLRLYQKVGATLVLKSPGGFGLFAEQGCGKTPMSIAVLCNECKKFREENSELLFKAIIVCPNPLKTNWEEELKAFTSRKGHVFVMEGIKMDRMVGLMQAFSKANAQKCEYIAVIISYDTLASDIDIVRKVCRWNLAIADESHYFKDPRTNRAEAMLALRDVCDKRVPMSGTPIGNSQADLWTQLEFMEKGASHYPDFRDFKNNFCTVEPIGYGIERVTGATNQEELKEILAKRAFIIKKSEVLKDIPEKVFEIVETTMTPQQAKAYNDLATLLTTQLDSVTSATVNHILTQLLRLAQITAGFLVTSDAWSDEGELLAPKSIHYFEDNDKIKTLLEFAEELPPNEKMIIWNHWIPMVEPIMEAFQNANHKIVKFRGTAEEKDRAVKLYNGDRSVRFFLANAASAGVGLTLNGYPKEHADLYDTNTTETVFFSYNWSNLQRQQAIDRSHRYGTRKQQRYRDLVVRHTIDMELVHALKAKSELAADVTSVVDLIKRLTGD